MINRFSSPSLPVILSDQFLMQSYYTYCSRLDYQVLYSDLDAISNSLGMPVFTLRHLWRACSVDYICRQLACISNIRQPRWVSVRLPRLQRRNSILLYLHPAPYGCSDFKNPEPYRSPAFSLSFHHLFEPDGVEFSLTSRRDRTYHQAMRRCPPKQPSDREQFSRIEF